MAFSIVDRNPMSKNLRYRVWTSWVEWRCFPLRILNHLAKLLRTGGLVIPDLLSIVLLTVAHGFKQLNRPKGRGFSRIDRLIKADSNVALGREVIYLDGFDLIDQLCQAAGVSQVGIMQR